MDTWQLWFYYADEGGDKAGRWHLRGWSFNPDSRGIEGCHCRNKKNIIWQHTQNVLKTPDWIVGHRFQTHIGEKNTLTNKREAGSLMRQNGSKVALTHRSHTWCILHWFSIMCYRVKPLLPPNCRQWADPNTQTTAGWFFLFFVSNCVTYWHRGTRAGLMPMPLIVWLAILGLSIQPHFLTPIPPPRKYDFGAVASRGEINGGIKETNVYWGMWCDAFLLGWRSAVQCQSCAMIRVILRQKYKKDLQFY